MLSARDRRSTDIKHKHFARHTSTGNESFSLLICLDRRYQISILRSVFTVIGTICVTIWAKPLSKSAKSPARLTLLIFAIQKIQIQHLVMIIWCQCLFKTSMCHLVNYLKTYHVLVSFVVYRPIQSTWSLTRLLNPPTLRHLHKFLVYHYQLRIWMAEIAVHIYITK